MSDLAKQLLDNLGHDETLLFRIDPVMGHVVIQRRRKWKDGLIYTSQRMIGRSKASAVRDLDGLLCYLLEQTAHEVRAVEHPSTKPTGA